MKAHWRFVIAVVLLGGTALLLQARKGSEIIAERTPLGSFPHSFNGWTGIDIPMAQDVLDVLGPGDFLLRNYHDPVRRTQLSLFIAYFPSQRAGDTIHSPKNCLPGAGWAPVRSDRIMMNVPGHAPFSANRYVIAKGQEQQLVLYWYWAHDRAVASEYAAKFYLVTDSIRLRRSDGSLIRLSTTLGPNQDVESAQKVLVSFASSVMSQINTYVPR
jgi:EpsI family protein